MKLCFNVNVVEICYYPGAYSSLRNCVGYKTEMALRMPGVQQSTAFSANSRPDGLVENVSLLHKWSILLAQLIKFREYFKHQIGHWIW